jgi:opacity protein-like surface antigen
MRLLRMAVAGSLLAAGSLQAAETSGFYVGFDVGMSRADIDKREIDRALVGAFESVGLIVLDGDSRLEEADGTYGLIAGYRIGPYLALEAQYLWLGEPHYRAEGTITDGVFVAPAKAEVEWDSKGAALSALGIWPLARQWELFARAGAYFAETSTTVSLSIDGLQARERLSKSTTELLWGVGGTYIAGANWSVRLEYQQVPDLGDEDRTGETDVERLNLAWLYRF